MWPKPWRTTLWSLGRTLKALGEGHPQSSIEARLSGLEAALPLQLKDGQTVGLVAQAHEQDASLTSEVLLENLACKASATMALRTLLAQVGPSPENIDYVINCGEEAVGGALPEGRRQSGQGGRRNVWLYCSYRLRRQGFLLRPAARADHGSVFGKLRCVRSGRDSRRLLSGQAGYEVQKPLGS